MANMNFKLKPKNIIKFEQIYYTVDVSSSRIYKWKVVKVSRISQNDNFLLLQNENGRTTLIDENRMEENGIFKKQTLIEKLKQYKNSIYSDNIKKLLEIIS